MTKKQLEQKIEQVLNNLSTVNVSNKIKAQAVADELKDLLPQKTLTIQKLRNKLKSLN